jgi:hypothetical protein
LTRAFGLVSVARKVTVYFFQSGVKPLTLAVPIWRPCSSSTSTRRAAGAPSTRRAVTEKVYSAPFSTPTPLKPSFVTPKPSPGVSTRMRR